MLQYDENKRCSASHLLKELIINKESENGNIYNGGCIDGQKSGYGILKWNIDSEEGGEYEGYWKKD